MSIEERLTKLNPKSQSFTDSAGGFGGMTVADLAGAMAGVKPIGELIIRRKYIDDKDKPEGYYTLLRKTVLKIVDKGLQPKKKDMIQPLFDIALDDYCRNFKCKQCEGKSQLILDTGQVHKCRSTRCHDGRVKRLDVDRARALGVKAMDFRRLYRPTFTAIENYFTRTLPEEESKSISIIKKHARWQDYPNS